MIEYSTRVVVANDRYVCLQLPPDWPEGEASITVTVRAATAADGVEAEAEPPLESSSWSDPVEPVRDEVEWWDEG
ncbi:hypothetical protein EP7_003485 [Isosphaeraceae bacterium EP7]